MWIGIVFWSVVDLVGIGLVVTTILLWAVVLV